MYAKCVNILYRNNVYRNMQMRFLFYKRKFYFVFSSIISWFESAWKRQRSYYVVLARISLRIMPAFWANKAVYTEGLVACCWAGAVTILYTQHQALAESLLIVSIAQIVLSRQFGSFL